jgi:hypothetical protein
MYSSCIAATVVTLCLINSDAPTAAELAILEARQSIVAGRVVVESKTLKDQGDGLKASSKSRYAIWFDQDRLRKDQQAWRPTSDGGWLQALDERVARVGDRILRYQREPYDRFRIVAKELTPSDGPNWESASTLLFDIRLLGLAPQDFSILYSAVPDGFVAAARKSPSIITESQNENGRIVAVSFTAIEGQRFELEIALDRGPNLVKGVVLNGSNRSSIECTLAQFPAQGAKGKRWFPSTVLYTQEIDGRTIRINEVKVVEAVFDVPQPESLFTWEGLGAAPGTLVERSIEVGGRLELFNGTSLEPFRPNHPTPRPAVATWDTAARRVLLRMGIGLGVLAAAVWAVWLLQRLRGGPAAQEK